MAVAISGYFDDSRTGDTLWTLAGYLAEKQEWDDFDSFWCMTMDTHGVPYLHIKEFPDPGGPYQKWLPAGDPQRDLERAQFLSACAHVIGTCGLKGFGSTVRMTDLQRFNDEKGLAIEPYSLALYGCILEINDKYRGEQPIELFFDRVEKVDSKIAKAVNYAESDQFNPGLMDNVQCRPLLKCYSFRNVLPIQAADFAAWELRKNHLNMHEWFEIEQKPSDWKERWEHLKKWSREKFGTNLPPTRKSFLRLFEMAPMSALVWDYGTLCMAQEARNGVWSSG